MFCIDASVIISAARGTEPYSNRSKAFLDFVRREKLQVFLPEIALIEVASGLIRATGRTDFATEFTRSFRAIPNFSFVPIDSRLADLATYVVVPKTRARSADAIYIAVALAYGVTLITLDRDQLTKGKKLIAVSQPHGY